MLETVLRTKLFAPPSRPDLVPRRHLLARHEQALTRRRKLTLIAAPAGSGKSTLLGEWIAAGDRPVAWVTLDGDGNPRRPQNGWSAKKEQTSVGRAGAPIWVGGFWPNKRPFRRMARWDGMFPLFYVHGPEQEPVFAAAVAFVRTERDRLGLKGPFDVIKMGMSLGDDPVEAAARVNAAAKAGATWWLELIMPEVYGFSPTDPQAYEVLRTRVLQGPPAAR